VTAPLNWPLGEYIIVREIDRGHFGTVYEARHSQRDAVVALKLILLDGPDSGEKVEAERQGAILQQRFSREHPRLVPEVFEHQQIETYYAVAMELVHGEPLTTQLRRGPLPAAQAARIALSLTAFLDKAHKFRTDIDGLPEVIVHADLKPAHVLLMPDSSIRVLDFGIAKALAARKPETTNKWGSIDYASPERLESGHVNEHVDFWSLGVMLFEMAAGFRPYRQYEGSPGRLESAIRRQEARAALPPSVDPVLGAIILKLLAPQLERRYQAASAIGRDLASFLGGAATVAAAEAASASRETIRIGGGAAAYPAPPDEGRHRVSNHRGPGGAAPASPPSRPTHDGVPTEKLPRPATVPPPIPGGRAARLAAAAGALHANTSKRLPGTFPFTLVKLLIVFAVVGMVVAEAAAVARADRLRDSAPMLEAAQIDEARMAYRHIADSPFNVGRRLVAGPLRDRMIELADRTILEFRAETPALARAQWEQALRCLEFAREVAPRDQAVSAKQAFVRGRLAWIRARDRADVDEAIRLLRDSARLDPSAPDPYLGLASIYAYSTRDLTALTYAISEAERRGYRRGRRERAELGDVHKVLADRASARAKTLAGEEQLEQLHAAAANYEKCVEYFDGLEFGESERMFRTCRTRLRSINAQIEQLAVPAIEFPAELPTVGPLAFFR
jgi:tetratricopeptide (TPR) repeat protein